MFFLPQHRRHAEFWEGVRDQGSVAMGISAWGLMTGVAMVKSGLSVAEALLMTFIVYAGSAQLAAVPMMVSGAPLWVILAAAFCVNLRFVVFSAHLRPYLMHLPRWERLVSGYVTGDLSYVFFARRYPKPGQTPDELARQQAYLMGNCAVNYVGWMTASVVGVVLANAIPTEWGLAPAGLVRWRGGGGGRGGLGAAPEAEHSGGHRQCGGGVPGDRAPGPQALRRASRCLTWTPGPC